MPKYLLNPEESDDVEAALIGTETGTRLMPLD